MLPDGIFCSETLVTILLLPKVKVVLLLLPFNCAKTMPSTALVLSGEFPTMFQSAKALVRPIFDVVKLAKSWFPKPKSPFNVNWKRMITSCPFLIKRNPLTALIAEKVVNILNYWNAKKDQDVIMIFWNTRRGKWTLSASERFSGTETSISAAISLSEVGSGVCVIPRPSVSWWSATERSLRHFR